MTAGALSLLFALGGPAHAQSAGEGGSALPMPVPPAVVARDDNGNVTVRATRITEAIRVDGRLDDSAYTAVGPVSLVQQEPNEGDLNSENTDVWVLFDEENLYFTCRCWRRTLTKSCRTNCGATSPLPGSTTI